MLLLHYMDMQLMLGGMVAVSGRHGIQDSSLLPWMLVMEELYMCCPVMILLIVPASRGLKEDFYNSLKEAIPSILSADCFISC